MSDRKKTNTPESCTHCAVAAEGGRKTVRGEEEKKALLSRCNRVEGQIRGIKRMIENDVWCDDVIHQISAARHALDAMSRIILERHMRSCLVSGIQSGDESIMNELLATIGKLMK